MNESDYSRACILCLFRVAGWIIRSSLGFSREHRVLRLRHGNVAFAVAPQNGVEQFVVGLVRMLEIHRGGFFRPRSRCVIDRVDQLIFQIAVVGFKGRLVPAPEKSGDITGAYASL